MLPNVPFRGGWLALLLIFFSAIAAGADPSPQNASPAVSASGPEEIVPVTRYILDDAKLIREPVLAQIISSCKEIEESMKIRIVIRTEILDDLEQYQDKVEAFFSDWIRSSVPEKRGILLYAALPRDSLRGKFNLRIGVGLKYLITREMGEKIVNQVILPNNLENKDGQGFLEGVLTIKRMLLDEYKREQTRTVTPTGTFDLLGFLWRSKELLLALLVAVVLCYFIFFIERCPRCSGSIRIEEEVLKEPGNRTLGIRRRVFSCERCGFSRRKKEPVYPKGRVGWVMWLLGTRKNVHLRPNGQGSTDNPSGPNEGTGHTRPE